MEIMNVIASKRSRFSFAGYTLIESNVATVMVGTFIAGILTMDSNLFGLIKNARESASANQSLQERVEQMRIANWAQITDANYLATKLMNTATSSAVGLSTPVEVLTVTPYPAKSITAAQVTRQGSAATINSTDAALLSESMVRVDLTLTWKGNPDQRVRTRSSSVLIAKGGVSK